MRHHSTTERRTRLALINSPCSDAASDAEWAGQRHSGGIMNYLANSLSREILYIHPESVDSFASRCADSTCFSERGRSFFIFVYREKKMPLPQPRLTRLYHRALDVQRRKRSGSMLFSHLLLLDSSTRLCLLPFGRFNPHTHETSPFNQFSTGFATSRLRYLPSSTSRASIYYRR